MCARTRRTLEYDIIIMRVVIVGLGEVGSYLAKILSSQEKYDVVGIDMSRKRLDVLEEVYDIQTIEGYGAAPHILRQAEVDKADIFLALTDNDEVNIVAALIVRSLGNAFTIARVSNPLFFEDQPLEDYEHLGINLLISPERRTALTLYQSIEYPHFLKVDTLGDGKVHINQYRIGAKSPFAYKQIRGIDLKGLLIVGITRKRDFLFPTGDTVVLPNDTLFIVGKHDRMEEAQSILPVDSKHIHRVILLGASRISFFLAKLIEKRYRVLIIEPDTEKSDQIAQLLNNTAIYNDDIFTSNLLTELMLNEHDYFIAATDNDEVNFLSSVQIKEHGVSMVACIIHQSYLLSAVEKAGIHQVFSPQTIIANDIAGTIRSRDLLTLPDFQNIDAEFAEFDILPGSPVADQIILDIAFPPQTLVVAILRNDDVLIPRGHTTLLPNDRAIVLYLTSNTKTITDLFGTAHAL